MISNNGIVIYRNDEIKKDPAKVSSTFMTAEMIIEYSYENGSLSTKIMKNRYDKSIFEVSNIFSLIQNNEDMLNKLYHSFYKKEKEANEKLVIEVAILKDSVTILNKRIKRKDECINKLSEKIEQKDMIIRNLQDANERNVEEINRLGKIIDGKIENIKELNRENRALTNKLNSVEDSLRKRCDELASLSTRYNEKVLECERKHDLLKQDENIIRSLKETIDNLRKSNEEYRNRYVTKTACEAVQRHRDEYCKKLEDIIEYVERCVESNSECLIETVHQILNREN